MAQLRVSAKCVGSLFETFSRPATEQWFAYDFENRLVRAEPWNNGKLDDVAELGRGFL